MEPPFEQETESEPFTRLSFFLQFNVHYYSFAFWLSYKTSRMVPGNGREYDTGSQASGSRVSSVMITAIRRYAAGPQDLFPAVRIQLKN